MWVTPRMTDIFILKELRKLRWLTARLQTWGGRRQGRHAGASLPRSLSAAPLPPDGLPPIGPLWGSRGKGAAHGQARQPGPKPQLFPARGHCPRALLCLCVLIGETGAVLTRTSRDCREDCIPRRVARKAQNGARHGRLRASQRCPHCHTLLSSLKWPLCGPSRWAPRPSGTPHLLHPVPGRALGRGSVNVAEGGARARVNVRVKVRAGLVQEPRPSPPTRPHPPQQVAGTHGVNAEGVGSQEDTADCGVQGEQRVLRQERVAVATRAGGQGLPGAGPTGPRPGLTSSRTGWPWPPRSSPRGRWSWRG